MAEYRSISATTMLSPVPAVLVSCKGTARDAKPNALAIAWAGTVCSHPPMVSISLKPDRYSYGLIHESREFVVNLVDEAHAKALDYCGVRSGREEDKLALCSLDAKSMEGMEYAPMLDSFPVSIGCRLVQALPLGSHEMMLGEIVRVQVRSDLIDGDGSLHLERAGLICYCHGVYQRTADALGFFGWSVARPETRQRRMDAIRSR